MTFISQKCFTKSFIAVEESGLTMDVAAKLYKEASQVKNSEVNKLHIRPSWILQESLWSLSSKFPLIPGSEKSLDFCTTLLGHKVRSILKVV